MIRLNPGWVMHIAPAARPRLPRSTMLKKARSSRTLSVINSVPTLNPTAPLKLLNIAQKVHYISSVDLNIDSSSSRTVTAAPAADSNDASGPARFPVVDAPSSERKRRSSIIWEVGAA